MAKDMVYTQTSFYNGCVLGETVELTAAEGSGPFKGPAVHLRGIIAAEGLDIATSAVIGRTSCYSVSTCFAPSFFTLLVNWIFIPLALSNRDDSRVVRLTLSSIPSRC